MKNHFQQYTSDIHLTRPNQDFIRNIPRVRHTVYAKNEKNAGIQNIHTYIVEWQIPGKVEPNTRA